MRTLILKRCEPSNAHLLGGLAVSVINGSLSIFKSTWGQKTLAHYDLSLIRNKIILRKYLLQIFLTDESISNCLPGETEIIVLINTYKADLPNT